MTRLRILCRGYVGIGMFDTQNLGLRHLIYISIQPSTMLPTYRPLVFSVRWHLSHESFVNQTSIPLSQAGMIWRPETSQAECINHYPTTTVQQLVLFRSVPKQEITYGDSQFRSSLYLILPVTYTLRRLCYFWLVCSRFGFKLRNGSLAREKPLADSRLGAEASENRPHGFPSTGLGFRV